MSPCSRNLSDSDDLLYCLKGLTLSARVGIRFARAGFNWNRHLLRDKLLHRIRHEGDSCLARLSLTQHRYVHLFLSVYCRSKMKSWIREGGVYHKAIRKRTTNSMEKVAIVPQEDFTLTLMSAEKRTSHTWLSRGSIHYTNIHEQILYVRTQLRDEWTDKIERESILS